jgi:hypothetical protein
MSGITFADPRPDFRRWGEGSNRPDLRKGVALIDQWEIAFDDEDKGLIQRWYSGNLWEDLQKEDEIEPSESDATFCSLSSTS